MDNYGAKGDGETDDANAFADAATVAAELGLPLTASSSKTYLLAFSDWSHEQEGWNDGIHLKTDTNFNGATIKLASTQSSNGVNSAFSIGKDEKTVHEGVDSGAFGRYKANDSEFFNKVLYVKSPLSWGYREGTTENLYHEQFLVCDAAGRYVNGIYYPEVVPGSYYVESWPIDCKHITFENAVFEIDGNYGINYLDVWRPYVTIKNLTFKGTTTYVGSGYNYCIRVMGYSVEILNCHGDRPWGTGNNGYMITLSGSNIVVKNISGNSLKSGYENWHDLTTMGNGFLQNCIFENLSMYRWDCHYEMMGAIDIRNCTFSGVNICGGWGTFNMENCTIVRQDRDYAIYRRNDNRLPYSGTMRFKDITFLGGRRDSGTVRGFDLKFQGEDIPNISNALYKYTDIILDSISCPEFSGYEFFLLQYNSVRYTMDKTRVIIKNCSFGSTENAAQYGIKFIATGPWVDDGLGFPYIKEFIFDNCDFTNSDFLSLSIRAKNLLIKNCIIPWVYYTTTSIWGDDVKCSGSVSILNCVFTNGSISGFANVEDADQYSYMLLGNIFKTTASYPEEAQLYLSQSANNNVVLTNEKTGQDSVNNVLV